MLFNKLLEDFMYVYDIYSYTFGVHVKRFCSWQGTWSKELRGYSWLRDRIGFAELKEF